MPNQPTYVSLFSSAGLGCFGFKMQGFDCIATAEINKRRLEIQKINNVAVSEDSYFDIDLSDESKLQDLFEHVETKLKSGNDDLDFLLATPPCQGMSVANHKKGNELPRNSLVVVSIKAVLKLAPKAFVFENVRAFLSATCLDLDGNHKSIGDAIQDNLSGKYIITTKVINLKEYGSPSSRTRTLVIGTRNDILTLSPDQIFPDASQAPTLKSLIGHMEPLAEMGAFDDGDFFHSFRSYDSRMLRWIQATPEGKSAFQNTKKLDRPNQIISGVAVENVNKNGDKYRRARWNDVPPCVHTRNDILASQNTVHPRDNRVFSIRELMLMMGVPDAFKWTTQSLKELNSLPYIDKVALSKKIEMNIRQCLGEGVPTPVFGSMAQKYSFLKNRGFMSKRHIDQLKFEKSNPLRKELAAYYTPPAAAAELVLGLSKNFKNKNRIRILEPSVGIGSFLPVIAHEFSHFKSVELTLIEIDDRAAKNLKAYLKKLSLPSNLSIDVLTTDYLTYEPGIKFDCIIGNPPFGKRVSKVNLFELFFKKALSESDLVAFVVPKVIASAHEFQDLRNIISKDSMIKITDLGERAFGDALIETINLVVSRKIHDDNVRVNSWSQSRSWTKPKNYLCDNTFPNWLIYRNSHFDKLVKNMKLNEFESYRDRSITRSMRKDSGEFKLLRGSNIARAATEAKNAFSWIDSEDIPSSAKQYFGKDGNLAVPNFTYYPRAIPMPKDCVADGSVAILIPKKELKLSTQQILFYSTEEFFYFYRVATNLATRTLNVDKSSSYYWGVPSIGLAKKANLDFVPTPAHIFKDSPDDPLSAI